MNFYVRMVRPVIEEAVVKVDAETLEEAQLLAAEAAAALPDSSWVRRDVGNDHAPTFECAVPEAESPNSWPTSDFWPKVSYTLLRANLDSMEGRLIPQPWMVSLSPLALADLAVDWSGDVAEVRERGVEGWLESLDAEALTSLGSQVLRWVAKGGAR